ncbi:Y-family DNA polymerase [Persicimonas caeni]|uniref:Y-family DNA polymerase n=1 Tax=Persicimonas caeni TaxID=2292766 RepID=UPI00143D9863|nr:DNA polymerase Y family protein [Persicimonas caeni]
MDRLACVNVIDLPLQLLLRRNPGWQERPVVVVDRDQPNGLVQWTNKYARCSRILPGMRYAQALSLKHDLHAGTVTDEEIAESVDEIARLLLDYTPVVEAAHGQPGIFWLGARGLDRLFRSFERWAKTVAEELLDKEGFYTTVVVGFSRFGTWAIARAKRGGMLVLDEADEQDRLVRRVPLEALHVDPNFRDQLRKLGIGRVGELLELPPEGVRRRFGKEALLLYRRARGDLEMPLTPYKPEDDPEEHLSLGAPETVSTKLVFWIKRYLHPLLSELERRQDKLTRLEVVFIYERAGHDKFDVRPAEPTTDEGQILDLLRLRLDALELRGGVVEIDLCAHTAQAQTEQLEVFVAKKKRDLGAANRALARLRAELGDEAVVRARLADGHLPEASYRWEPIDRLDEAQPDDIELRPLVRRIRRRPEPLSHSRLGLDLDRQRDRQRDRQDDSIELAGPFVVSGGWWAGGVHRDYHFAQTPDGEIVWVYWDEKRQRWYRHGGFE